MASGTGLLTPPAGEARPHSLVQPLMIAAISEHSSWQAACMHRAGQTVADTLTAPTWLTAIFTGVLAAGAIVTAILAAMAFRKQSRELAVLQAQASDAASQLRRPSQLCVWRPSAAARRHSRSPLQPRTRAISRYTGWSSRGVSTPPSTMSQAAFRS
jgi:hypothetical protein